MVGLVNNHLEGDHAVLESSGEMGAYGGKSYIPHSGWSISDMKLEYSLLTLWRRNYFF